MEAIFYHLLLLLAISLLEMQVLSSSPSNTKKFHFNVSSTYKKLVSHMRVCVFRFYVHVFLTWKKPEFQVEWKTITRLCHSKPVLTVNGKFPGPTITVNEGDDVQVTVTNKVARNTTIHWYVYILFAIPIYI